MRGLQRYGRVCPAGWNLLCLFGLATGVVLCGVPATAQPGADRVAILVNQEPITEAEFYQRLQRVRAQDFIISLNPLQLDTGTTAGQVTVNSLINERLILQWAEKTKQLPSEAEIAEELERVKQQPGAAQALAGGTLTEEAMRYNIKVFLARFNIATTAASLSPAEVEAYYKAHINEYSTPERWGLALLATNKAADVPKIQAELKAGRPFDEIVKSYSIDPRAKETAGQQPMRPANDPAIPAPIRDAVKKLQVGQVTPPIKLEVSQRQGGPSVPVYFFARLTSKEPAVSRSFAEVKLQVERAALLERAGGMQVAEKKIREFRQQSKIVVNLPGYENLASPAKS
jgi:parvulin-like peptidyl-prolyl isomerase